MVKNSTGGNKSKGFARKNMTKKDNGMRVASEDGEIYAQAVKVMGGKIVSAIDIDGQPLRAHIRGKFRRGKRDNFIVPNTWLLVGLHEWQSSSSTNNTNARDCDILEVYNDADKHKLKNSVTNVNWKLFQTNDNKTFASTIADTTVGAEADGGIKFNEDDCVLEDLISATAQMNIVSTSEEEVQVNVDDI
jgi:translation initiation factor IF-1